MNDYLAEYKKYRAIGKDLNTKLFKVLNGAEIRNAARQLDILKNNKLVMEREEEMDLFADFALHDFINKDGKNAIQRFLEHHGEELTPEEQELLQSQLAAKSSLFEVGEVDTKHSSILLTDLFNEHEQIRITDIGFSSSLVVRRFLFFTRTMSVRDMSMTTGAAMVFEKENQPLIFEKYEKIKKKINIKNQDAKRYAIFFKLNRRFGYDVRFKDV